MASTTSSGANTGGSGGTATGGGVGVTQSTGTTTNNNMTEAALKTMFLSDPTQYEMACRGSIMLSEKFMELFGVAWMFRSFEWIYWNDEGFTIFLFGLLVWGWFRACKACFRVLRLWLPKRRKKKKKCKRNRRNGAKEFHRRKLPYHLAMEEDEETSTLQPNAEGGAICERNADVGVYRVLRVIKTEA
ncbi:hypothetical protein THAOC_24649 [Thalassiosira oceanica]|uniref:Uncharacterized protein n=1 Tax=Thalassiosira oceanica TaxID=159749 RepID=K0RTB1_THAOC|nr:hypothetical protein THAOC_24649 [Thalassiosira oceanica]|eukprot:EJK55604.1 hypothetical protein THAOC_24649 [Thalassiosira oceanica]